MKKYPEYKLFKELWLNKIPANWTAYKLKYLFSERSEKGFPKEPLLVASQNMGVVPKSVYGNRTVEPMKDLHLLKLVKTGDFVISLRSFQGGLEYAYYRGIISPAYTVITPGYKIVPGYFRYLAKSRLFIELLQTCVTGIREGQNIDYTILKNHRIPVPPREEQDQIVRYLDWQVSKINKLIAAKKKEIELLVTRKQSIINDVITHGLNPHVTTKYSGVKWIGNIPENWKIVKLRSILSRFSQKGHPELQLLSVVREQGVIVRDVEDIESNHNFIPDDLSGYKVVRKNQFVINKMKAWQGSYGISRYEGIVSPAYFVFNVNFGNLEYFHYAIRSKIYVNFFAQASDGIRVGQWDLSMDKMKNIPFLLPPENEQAAIVEYIPEQISLTDKGISTIQSQINILTDLKTRLISDVVTGQIDVRGIEVPEFEYTGEVTDENATGQDENEEMEE